MSRQIIKQPNGRYCIFSSIVDNVTISNMSVEDIIEEWVNEARKEITKDVKNKISQLEKGGRPYSQFTMPYSHMLSFIEEIHGEKERLKVQSLIEKK